MPAARGKDMRHYIPGSLPRTTKRLHFFIVSLDLSRLRHFVDQVGYEETETLLLFALQQRIADLIALGSIIGLRRLLVLEHLQHDSVAAAIDRAADLSRLSC